ncbi:hypothetical protein HH214_21315 [Mucilaginibacter robiniae]|uniref:D-isomer specific 2-hydroxyacid dehydrogenase NAD-binding domain-containing protein n=1 Tax=Mucilaginibacter robiniae TaxID=2728022 RepID=A0A7L5E5E4_9SPHI|nr:hypothetical protein HH214_21315 [Mucilaginibacter robiniae]
MHLVLSDGSRNTIGQAELALVKSSAYLINTSLGPLVNETALIETLRTRKSLA